MNRIYYILPFLLLISSCIGKYQSDAPKAVVNPAIDYIADFEDDTLKMNIAKSKIDWIATEMRGAKRRTGIISFKDGFFLSIGSEIVGGNFKVDMETINVTDIPFHEKIARKKLLHHLKSDDFFNVAHYLVSAMEFTNVQKIGGDSLSISGNFTIRGVTKNIEFLALQKDSYFRTNFTFNQLDWNIAYKGSWANKNLVDSDVELIIEIVVK